MCNEGGLCPYWHINQFSFSTLLMCLIHILTFWLFIFMHWKADCPVFLLWIRSHCHLILLTARNVLFIQQLTVVSQILSMCIPVTIATVTKVLPKMAMYIKLKSRITFDSTRVIKPWVNPSNLRQLTAAYISGWRAQSIWVMRRTQNVRGSGGERWLDLKPSNLISPLLEDTEPHMETRNTRYTCVCSAQRGSLALCDRQLVTLIQCRFSKNAVVSPENVWLLFWL